MSQRLISEPAHKYNNFISRSLQQGIGVKNNHNTAFCHEELNLGTVIEKAMKSETSYRPIMTMLLSRGDVVLFSCSLAKK